MNDMEIAISIQSWLAADEPKNVWFTIVRHAPLDDMKIHPEMITALSNIIIARLESLGRFETRKTEFVSIFGDNVFIFKDKNNREFSLLHTTGNVNGETVPVVALSIDARKIDNE